MTTTCTPGAAPLRLDHLVLACLDLDEGARWLGERLGAAPEPGGRHEGFGTHNRLLSLGEGVYLELLAADPAQPAPPRPRLFGMEAPRLRERLAHGPRLLHWVVRAGSPAQLEATVRDPLGATAGRVVSMSRGVLAWRIALRDDGECPPGGLPTPIDWGAAPHPCTLLPDRGVRLAALEAGVAAPVAEWLRGRLDEARLALRVAEAPCLRARLQAADGRELVLEPPWPQED